MGIWEEQAVAERLGLETPVRKFKCKCGGTLFAIKKVNKYGIDCIEPIDDLRFADEIHCTNCNEKVDPKKFIEEHREELER